MPLAISPIGSTFYTPLARQSTLDTTVQDHYLAQARQQGFDLGPLIQTPHTGHPTA